MSVVEEVSADRVRAHVEHITTQIPSRLAGSQNAKRMAQYSAAALSKEGIPARVLEMPGLVSFPEKAEMRFRRADGTWVWLESVSSDFLSDADINAVVVNFHDITEQKQLREKKNQFLSLVSYQLHTPLETIRKYADSLLSNKKQLSVLEQNYIQEIDRSSIEMTKHVENLLKIFRIEVGILDVRPKVTKLRKEVEDALQRVANRLTAKRIRLEKRFTLQGSTINLDPFIFTSLLTTFISGVIARMNEENKILVVEITEHTGRSAIKITPAKISTHDEPDFLVAKALAAYMGVNVIQEIGESEESLLILMPLAENPLESPAGKTD